MSVVPTGITVAVDPPIGIVVPASGSGETGLAVSWPGKNPPQTCMCGRCRQTSHRSRLAFFVIDVDDLDAGVTFWAAALDAKEEPLSKASSKVYRRLRLPASEVRILLQHTDDPKSHKKRMHLDLESDDVEAEVRRLEALAATRYDHQRERGYDFWVLRDPWSNEFCVLQTNFPRPPRPAPALAGLTGPGPARCR